MLINQMAKMKVAKLQAKIDKTAFVVALNENDELACWLTKTPEERLQALKQMRLFMSTLLPPDFKEFLQLLNANNVHRL